MSPQPLLAETEYVAAAYHECKNCGRVHSVSTKLVIDRKETEFLRGVFWRCPWCLQNLRRPALTIVWMPI